MPDDQDAKLDALRTDFEALRTRFEKFERACAVVHSKLNEQVESVTEELTAHDREIDLLRAALKEHEETLKEVAKTLKQVEAWVGRWGMETTTLGRHLEHLDERQSMTAKTTQAILEKLGDVFNVVNQLAARGSDDGR
jgi:predicted RNase H-like nuclease (RuvC/YqgF family)